jgi:hypothetical protein
MMAAVNINVVPTSFAGALVSRGDLIRIFRDEKFDILKHVLQISSTDWVAAGVTPQGRSITSSMVDAGKGYEGGDVWDTNRPLRQLLLAAKNPHHEVICFWQGSQGGPFLRVMMIERGVGRPRLVFYAIMHNDISQSSWNWEEVKRHILENRMDVTISAEHPGIYDNRLP